MKEDGHGRNQKKILLDPMRYNREMNAPSELQKLELLRDKALNLMTTSGFTFSSDILVKLDPDLPYMGYTTEKNGLPLIVVSGNTVKGDMALSLLIHELSHVYRTQTRHPSHNPELLTSVAAWVMHGKAVLPYQEKIIYSIFNTIQDVYADDISFKVFAKTSMDADLNEFFMSWIHEPVKAKTTEQKWENAEKLINAAFAQANLERHGIKDTDNKVQKAISTFLKKHDDRVAEQYMFFKVFLVAMPEEITDKDFEKILIKYLSQFIKLTTI